MCVCGRCSPEDANRKLNVGDGVFPRKCNECENILKDRGGMRRHMREIHWKIKNHVCEVRVFMCCVCVCAHKLFCCVRLCMAVRASLCVFNYDDNDNDDDEKLEGPCSMLVISKWQHWIHD